MSALVLGDDVTIACPICMWKMDPQASGCSTECKLELAWRRELVVAKSRYKLDPASRLGKLAARRDREGT